MPGQKETGSGASVACVVGIEALIRKQDRTIKEIERCQKEK
jgi:hypothetical protein